MTTFHADKIGTLTVPEMSIWGLASYMTDGNQEIAGVMPPIGLEDCPCDIDMGTLAGLVGITEEHCALIWASLIEKGAITDE